MLKKVLSHIPTPLVLLPSARTHSSSPVRQCKNVSNCFLKDVCVFVCVCVRAFKVSREFFLSILQSKLGFYIAAGIELGFICTFHIDSMN